jgi:uncharacterized protein YpuA (DUF1002 family)
MDKKFVVGTFALLAVAAVGASLVSAFPMGFGRFNKEMTAEEIGAMYENRQAMIKAIESNDYETWRSLMEQKIEKMKSELTEENFNKIVEMHNTMKENNQQREQIKNALENGDYETAKQLIENLPNEFRGLNMRGGGFI